MDGHSLANRAFHALPPFTTSSGEPTGAIHGFLTVMFRLLDEEAPTHLAVAFDRSEPTFRHELYAEYKAQRPEGDPSLRRQLPVLAATLDALGWPVVSVPGFEADDVIGTLARRAEEAGMTTLILTGDRDLLQLVDDATQVLLTRSGTPLQELARLGPADVEAMLGVRAQQIPDYKGLAGDSSDNLTGVKGIGPKLAARLLSAAGSLEAVLADPARVAPTPRVAQLLTQHADDARLCKELATIRRDAPVEVPLERLRLAEPGPQAYRALERLELRSLLKRLAPVAPAVASAPAVPPGDGALGSGATVVLARDAAGWAVWAEGGARTVASEDAARQLVDEHPVAGHDVKALLRPLYPVGRPPRVAFDSALAAYLLSPGQSSYALNNLCESALGTPAPADAAGQAAAVARLGEALLPRIREDGLERLLEEVELPLVRVLTVMERNGIGLDLQRLEELRAETDQALARLAEEIHDLAGQPFNINSTRQLADVLFGSMGLKPVKKTKTGFSTDQSVLEELAPEHLIVQRILEHRQLQKLKSTYLDVLGSMLDERDGRLHTTFNQTVAATGRLSSQDPNLQNIPVRLEYGRRIREVFVPPTAGRLFLTADYSQIELRVLAHLSGDEALIANFRDGEDIHTRTAAAVHGVPVAAVTGEMRRAAKAINFGVIYGISDYRLARELGVPRAEGARFIQEYFERYPRVRAYLDEQVATARERGFVTTLLGRRRYLPDLRSQNRQVRAFAERTAMNTPIQGSAADIIKVAMVQAFEALEARGWEDRMLLQVHDELIFECPPEEVGDMREIVEQAMAGAVALKVPLEVEVRAGPTWYAVEPVGA